MRRTLILLSCLLLFIVLAACSKSATETKTKGETIEVEIEDASYIISGLSGGDSIEDEEAGGLFKIDLLVKNTTDSSIDIFPEMHIQLYDGDNQIDPSLEMNAALDLKTDPNNSIGANKQKTMSVLFDVDKDTEYEINISPMSKDFEKEIQDVTISIDTSEYNDSLEALHDPKKALEAFVETIFFDKENSDYEKFVSADKNSLQEDATRKFEDSLKMMVSSKISDSDVEKYYESFKQASAEKNEIEAELIGNANGKAIVKLNYSALSYEDLSDELNDYKDKYREKHDGYNPEKEDEYALSKFDSALDKLEARKGNRELEIQMIEQDGKWSIDDSNMDWTKNLIMVFAEGFVM